MVLLRSMLNGRNFEESSSSPPFESISSAYSISAISSSSPAWVLMLSIQRMLLHITNTGSSYLDSYKLVLLSSLAILMTVFVMGMISLLYFYNWDYGRLFGFDEFIWPLRVVLPLTLFTSSTKVLISGYWLGSPSLIIMILLIFASICS